MIRALLLVLLLAGCASVQNKGVNFHVGVSNVWTFEVMRFDRKNDDFVAPPALPDEDEDDDV